MVNEPEVSLRSEAGIGKRRRLRQHHQVYQTFWSWSDAVVDYAMLNNRIYSAFGWNLRIGLGANTRSIRNFPMQANGAEMLRLACCLATERGIQVCAPVHDAILIEAPLSDLEQQVALTQATMAEASAVVLAGFELRTDVKLIRYPDHYEDPRGEKMWEMVWNLIEEKKSA